MSLSRASSPSDASRFSSYKSPLSSSSSEIKQCKKKGNAVWDGRQTGKACPQLLNSLFNSTLFLPPHDCRPLLHPLLTRLRPVVEIQTCETPGLWSRPASDERVSRISFADASLDDMPRAFAERRAAGRTSPSRLSATIPKPEFVQR